MEGPVHGYADFDDNTATFFLLDSTRHLELRTDAKRHPTYKEKRYR